MEKNTASTVRFKPSRIFGSLIAATAVAAMMAPSAALAADLDLSQPENQPYTQDEAKTQIIGWNTATNNAGNTLYYLQLEEDELKTMSVDVPVAVYLAVDEHGNFMTPTALKNIIENDSEFPVNVSAMQVTAKNDFNLQSATAFASSDADNIFKGNVSSVALNAAGDGIDSTKQSIAFTKAATEFAKNTAWAMEASNSVEKAGDDCLFIQIDGALANVKGKYFTAPINVFDITYTFEATNAALNDPSGAISDSE